MDSDAIAAAIVGVVVAAITKLGPRLIDIASAWLDRLRPNGDSAPSA